MPTLTALFLLLLCAAINAHAQNSAHSPQLSASELEKAGAACDQLAAMPNPPMSVAACKAMVDMGTSLNAGAADSSAQRPGDEAMTCTAIFTELKTMAGVGISDINTARTEAIVRDGTALANRQAGELNAFIAESYALGAVAGLVGAFTPNFVGAAIAAAWQGQAIALGAKLTAEQAPLHARTNETLLASANELSQSMNANPRFARLGQLAMNRQCEPPAEARR